ncbi:hypothetical protein TNCV_3726211 [Trichonephila clavipes]|nr:hypothetical protein TNCV_3726211 [Trichonephila clavipes]
MGGVSDQSFIPSNIGRGDDKEKIPPAHGVTQGDCGSLAVKDTDVWQTYHEFELNAAEDPPCKGGRGSNTLPRCGV